jgi:excisionase family DNA binding protein
MLRLLVDELEETQGDSVPRANRSGETALDDAPILISRTAAARRLNVSVHTVARLLRERELEGVLVRGRRMVSVASLHALIDRNRDK